MNKKQEEPTRFKIVVVGDKGVGKTSIIRSFTTNEFNEQELSTVFDCVSATVRLNQTLFNLFLIDSSSVKEDAEIRKLTYHNCDAFLIVFAINQPQSLTNSRAIWEKEIAGVVQNPSIIYVGNKIDLRKMDASQIGQEQAKTFFEQYGTYIQCSAKTQLDIFKVFDLAVTEGEGIQQDCPPLLKKRSKNRCCILI